MINRIIIVLFFIFSSSFFVVATEKKVQGKVTTFDSIPIIGASIHKKSSKKIVYTDSLGMFTFSCLQKDKLSVTTNGFSRQNVKITKNTQFIFVNLKLQQGEQNREI